MLYHKYTPKKAGVKPFTQKNGGRKVFRHKKQQIAML
jgi:hypothetical protein